MTEKEARLLMIRAADGELTPDEQRRLEAYLAAHPAERAFLAEEKEAAAVAEALGQSLRLPAAGLEDEVLRRMGMRPRASLRARLLLIAGAAAAALVAALFWFGSDDGAPAQRKVRETARFEPVDGEGARNVDPGVYHLADGTTQVTVDEPTLVETKHGVVELDPGDYHITVGPDDVTVKVAKGRAVISKRDGGRITVVAGEKSVETRWEMEALDRKTNTVAAGDARVVGRVVDSDGAAIEGARIWVSGDIVTRTDADGRFETGVTGTEVGVGVFATGFAPADLRRIRPAERAVFEMEFVMRNRGGELTVRVEDDKGKPIPGATVTVGGHYRNLPIRYRSEEGYPLHPVPARSFETDAGGRIHVDANAPEWNGLTVTASGYSPHETWVRIPPEGKEERVVKLHRGGVVTGRVVDAAGAPVAGAQISFRHQGSGRVFPGVEATTAADGAFRATNVPTWKVEIVANAKDGRHTAAWLEPGETRTWRGTLQDAYDLTGTVLYGDGTPVAGAHIMCRRAWRDVGGAPLNSVTREDGQFRFEKLSNVLHEIHVWHPRKDYTFVTMPSAKVRTLPSQSPTTVVLERRDEAAPGHLTGVVVLPDGGAGRQTRVRAWPVGHPGWGTATLTADDGSFELKLAPGTYHLEVHRDGQPTLHRDGLAIAAGETNHLGTVSFPRAGRIRGRIVKQDGSLWPHGTIGVQSLDQSIYYSVKKQEDGSSLSEDLVPGRYLVFGGAAGLFEEVDVRAGETTEIDVPLRTGRQVVLTFRALDGNDPRQLSYEVRDPQGRRIYYASLDHGDREVKIWIVSGTYRVTATDERQRKGGAELVVPDGGVDPLALEVMLRGS